MRSSQRTAGSFASSSSFQIVVVRRWFAPSIVTVISDGLSPFFACAKSLAANALVFTPLADTWLGVHPQSLEAVRQFLLTRLFGPLLEPLVTGILALPGWAVIGVPGVLLAWAGRSRRERVFVRQDML